MGISLDDLPRLPMGAWPTPVVQLERVSERFGVEVWAKLEERCGAWGGNKVRKLEYWLHEARTAGVRELVTVGAGSSSWAAAVALHGTNHGFAVTLGLAGPVPEHYERLYRSRDVSTRRLPRDDLLPLLYPALVPAARLRGAAFLPVGGSGSWGDVGSASAGVETGEASASDRLPHFERAFVAAGTGGTSAGLAVGLALAGVKTEVVAVRVTPRPLGTVALVRARARRLLRFLNRRGLDVSGVSPAPVAGDDRFFAPAYGVPNPQAIEARDAAAEDGLVLDTTYAAKAFAALLDEARHGGRGPMLFLATSPGPLKVSSEP